MSARADPRGGRSAMVVPTATSLTLAQANKKAPVCGPGPTLEVNSLILLRNSTTAVKSIEWGEWR